MANVHSAKMVENDCEISHSKTTGKSKVKWEKANFT